MEYHSMSRQAGGLIRGLALTGAALSVGLFAGCASMPPPTAQVAVAAAALSHAIEAGGNEAAPEDIRHAREKLDHAKLAMTSKDYSQALQLAQEAQVDAQLAEARAHASKADQAAGTVKEGNKVLREEMQRQVAP